MQGSVFKVPTNNLRDFPDRFDFRWWGAGSFPEQRLVIEFFVIEFEFGMFTYERGASQVTIRKTSRRREQAQPAYGMSMRPVSRLHW